jgi:YebC/PmpR family DNA-binding regulatory protein
MSGHSKWSKIKRKKGANDAKRSQIFTKLIKEITVASRLGGPDPDGNARLYLAIQNAKGANMPKDNIDRAIKKGSGSDAANYTEVNYEAYGPGKMAIFIECATDNTNRTVADIRSYLTKAGGSLATSGTFDFIFEQKGVCTFRMPAGMDADELTLEMIDAGAEDVEIEEDEVTVTSSREDFGPVQKKLRDMKIEVKSANLQRVPKIFKKLDADEFKKAMKLIDQLEDHDDIQNVYHNIEMTEELMNIYEG